MGSPKMEKNTSSYEKVRGGKLSFKGGLEPSNTHDKTKKRKIKKITHKTPLLDSDEQHPSHVQVDGENVEKQVFEIDTGTGYAPDGKKSKKYEDLFPVETKRFGYEIPKGLSREEALDARAKKKADRYCK